MTFCMAIKVNDGLVALADTRITSGTERITARKVTVHQHGRHSFFVMTSGLRAVRDKALTYYEELLEAEDASFDKLYKAVNAFAAQVRRVAQEDRAALQDAGLVFDLTTIIGGQLESDAEHKLYLVYPQGNWVEVGRGSPYYAIGESSYGKPLLDRALRYETSLPEAVKIAYLAFDATRTSATDVDFPVDMVLYRRDSYEIVEHRYTADDLVDVSRLWQQWICRGIDEVPEAWVSKLVDQSPQTPSPNPTLPHADDQANRTFSL